jgi:DNA-binding transcriptional MerR regulator
MTKSPDAFRTISEVADQLDVPAHVLRFWETRFAQVKPVKRGGGRRYYRPDDVRLLRGIRGLLYDDGLTIKGVQKILREHGVRHVISLGALANGEDAIPAPRAVPHPVPLPEPALAGAGAPVGDGVLVGDGAAAQPDSPRPDGARPDGALPQADLFDCHASIPAASGRPELGPVDRDALRRLVGELEALRAEMVGTGPRG